MRLLIPRICIFLFMQPCWIVNASSFSFLPPAFTEQGASDASAALKIDSFYLVGDDEVNLLRLYPSAGGEAVKEWDLKTLGATLKKELDIESIAYADNTIYVMGSHSNKSSGKKAQKHSGHLLSMNMSGRAPFLEFSGLNQYSMLDELLIEYDENNHHGLGKNHLGFAQGLAKGQVPESIEGFSIEGMVIEPKQKTLLLGFRAPLVKENGTHKAIIVPLILDQDITQISLNSIKPAQLLDLGNRGIRDIYLLNDSEYLILAGPATATDFSTPNQFALYHWKVNERAKLVTDGLDKYLIESQGSFEAIAEVQYTDKVYTVVLLMDNGDTLIDGIASKKSDVQKQKFFGQKIKIEQSIQ